MLAHGVGRASPSLPSRSLPTLVPSHTVGSTVHTCVDCPAYTSKFSLQPLQTSLLGLWSRHREVCSTLKRTEVDLALLGQEILRSPVPGDGLAGEDGTGVGISL